MNRMIEKKRGENKVKILAKYVINPCTVIIKGFGDHKGHLYSKVTEGGEEFIVTMSPKGLINSSLLYYCSSLKGAIDGSRSILGNISMLPIMINPELDIFLFPSCSPNRPDCIWMSLYHVQRSEKSKPHQTRVDLSFGHSIVIDMKRSRFELKKQRAMQLRYINSERSEKIAKYVMDGQKETLMG